jgi:hypothetical protein
MCVEDSMMFTQKSHPVHLCMKPAVSSEEYPVKESSSAAAASADPRM